MRRTTKTFTRLATAWLEREKSLRKVVAGRSWAGDRRWDLVDVALIRELRSYGCCVHMRARRTRGSSPRLLSTWFE
eukprot:scaffold4396_cov196-Pinguiococcus_pyrenoidosus.AAC.5